MTFTSFAYMENVLMTLKEELALTAVKAVITTTTVFVVKKLLNKADQKRKELKNKKVKPQVLKS